MTKPLTVNLNGFDQDVFDLRQETAQSATVWGPTRQGNPISKWLIYLPEALEELTIHGGGYYGVDVVMMQSPPEDFKNHTPRREIVIVVGPHIRALSLAYVIIVARETATYFPSLEALTLYNCAGLPTLVGTMPRLSNLTLKSWSSDMNELFREVALESLTLFDSGDDYATSYSKMRLPLLGSCLKTLKLNEAFFIPEVEEWERLESLTIVGRHSGILTVPFIRWLRELTIDEHVVTNGHIVSSLEHYRQAWGLKPAKSARSVGPAS